jgi:hypothetical protein
MDKDRAPLFARSSFGSRGTWRDLTPIALITARSFTDRAVLGAIPLMDRAFGFSPIFRAKCLKSFGNSATRPIFLNDFNRLAAIFEADRTRDVHGSRVRFASIFPIFPMISRRNRTRAISLASSRSGTPIFLNDFTVMSICQKKFLTWIVVMVFWIHGQKIFHP